MKTKKVFFYLAVAAVALSQTLQAQPKKVAVLEPIGNVTDMQKTIIRAKLAEALAKSGRYETLTRTNIDQLMNEFRFQNSGLVSDVQRQSLGKLSGAELLCITRLASEGDYFFVESSLIDMESGAIVETANQLMPSSPITKLEEGCIQLAAMLVGQGGSGIAASAQASADTSFAESEVQEAQQLSSAPTPADTGFVGNEVQDTQQTFSAQASVNTSFAESEAQAAQQPFSSPASAGTGLVVGGVQWAAANADSNRTFAARPDMYTPHYTFNSNPCPAGWRVPTRREFRALNSTGSTWVNANTRGNAVAGRFYGKKHASCTLPDNMAGCIFLPAAGLHNNSSESSGLHGYLGYYWSSTQYNNTVGYNWYFYTSNSSLGNSNKANGMSIRCVQ